jgi:hypothetical protein
METGLSSRTGRLLRIPMQHLLQNLGENLSSHPARAAANPAGIYENTMKRYVFS